MPFVREQSGGTLTCKNLYFNTHSTPTSLTYTFTDSHEIAFAVISEVQLSEINPTVSVTNCTATKINEMSLSDSIGSNTACGKSMVYKITDIKSGSKVTLNSNVGYHGGLFVFSVN